jgi:hypothetical protein
MISSGTAPPPLIFALSHTIAQEAQKGFLMHLLPMIISLLSFTEYFLSQVKGYAVKDFSSSFTAYPLLIGK